MHYKNYNELLCFTCFFQELVISAVTGIIVGLSCALPILIVATMNVFVGIMATVNIALITVTVLGFIPMMGWKLGVSIHLKTPQFT